MKYHYDEIMAYRKKHTLKETGEKFGLTSERIRQIQHLKSRMRCEKHDRYYYNVCSHCLAEKYRGFLKKLTIQGVLNEVKKEAKNRKRDYLSTMRRAYLVDLLYGFYGYSFTEISKLLKRDYSTIGHLFRKLNNSNE